MTKILVTGGCGFVGSNLVDILVQDPNNEVWVVDDLSSGKKEYCNEKAKYLFVDILRLFDESIYQAAIRRVIKKKYTHVLRDIDIVYHLAAQARIQPSFSAPINTLEINTYGTSLICEYTKRIGAKLIYAGSSSFYAGVFLSPYAFAKWQGEQICKLYSDVYGLNTAIARFFNVYGPRHPSEGHHGTVVGIFERQYKQNQALTIVGNGEQRRDFTHVKDICEGLIAISKKDFKAEILNLGTGTNHSINELASLYQCKTKNISARPGEASVTLADISKTMDILNWKPRYTLENYVEEWLEFHRGVN